MDLTIKDLKETHVCDSTADKLSCDFHLWCGEITGGEKKGFSACPE
jgi:hypothetical protein